MESPRHEEGYDACFWYDLNVDENPHLRGTTEAADWDAGYLDAVREQQRICEDWADPQ